LYRTALRAEGADPRTRTPAAARCRDTGTTRRATRRALLALAPVALVATALFGWCTRAEHLAPPLDDRATSAAADLGAAASPAFAAVLPAAGPTPRIPARADTLADEPLRRTVLAVPVAAAPKVVRVTGRVADSGGFSMAGVRVRAVALERQAPDESARVDDYGHFEFTGLRHGPWALSVDTQGLRRDLLLAEPAPRRDVVVGDADQDAGLFVIERAASLGGRVVAADGSPIRLAQVRARGDSRMSQQTFTDGNGEYHLAGLRPGYYRIAVSLEQAPAPWSNLGLPRPAETELHAGETATVPTLVCGAGTRELRGVVVDEQGAPVRDLPVECLEAGSERWRELILDRGLSAVRTAADGPFRLANLVADAVELHVGDGARCEGITLPRLQRAVAPLRVRVLQGEVRDVGRVQVTLHHPYRLEGRVVAPLAAAARRLRQLRAVIDAGTPAEHRVPVGADGTFRWFCPTPRAPLLVRVEYVDDIRTTAAQFVHPQPDATDALSFYLPP
jgi:hypothetical protein